MAESPKHPEWPVPLGRRFTTFFYIEDAIRTLQGPHADSVLLVLMGRNRESEIIQKMLQEGVRVFIEESWSDNGLRYREGTWLYIVKVIK